MPLVGRLPASLRRRSRLRPGAVVRDPVAIWDFLPTFAEIAGTPAPAVDGVSFVPYLLGRDDRFAGLVAEDERPMEDAVA